MQATAEARANPPEVRLSWPAEPSATGFAVYRKRRDDSSWGTGIALPGAATGYTDSNVADGGAYEYRIRKTTSSYSGEGYIYVGVQAPLIENRGKVVLLVDDTMSSPLASEIAELQSDLAGDGWTVLRHDVPRMATDPANTNSSVWAARANEIAQVKALIRADYSADPANVKAVFLLGRVAVPYSGKVGVDAHSDHIGAWPADVYYADMNGSWTDSTWRTTTAADKRHWNLVGDGKQDNSELPANLVLQVGRVDFANLPAFPQSETELLRRYLGKNHNFRHKLFSLPRRGWIDDHFGVGGAGAPVAVNGWRNFSALLGRENIAAGPDWTGTLSANGYLWGYGCGGGSYTSCSGLGSTTDFAASDLKVAFTMFFGSYFGDWDSRNNLLRAAVASGNHTLASAWVGRPYWQFHHMGAGETIGFSTRISQNNNSLYESSFGTREIHIALMGDPTLRMHVVAPVSGLAAQANGSGGADLSWNASPDSVLGYHVYRAGTAGGPFTRVNANLIPGTTWTDANNSPCVYMVRAVKLEVTPSGSYYNASQGIFQDFAASPAKPVLTITARDASKVYGAPVPALEASYAGFVDGDTPASLEAQPVLSTTAASLSPAGAYPIHASGAVSSKYTLQYTDGTLTVNRAATTGSVSASANPASPGQSVVFTFNASAVPPGAGSPGGSAQFRVDGVPAGSPAAMINGTASLPLNSLARGLHTLQCEYPGDSNFLGVTNQLAGTLLIDTAPVASPDAISRPGTNAVKIRVDALLQNDTDADGDALEFSLPSSATVAGGQVSIRDGWVFYAPPGAFAGEDSFNYAVADSLGLASSATVAITPGEDPDSAPNLTVTDLGGGTRLVEGYGIPGRAYQLQYSDDAEHSNWVFLAWVTAGDFGEFSFQDSSAGERVYRTFYP